MTSRHNTAAKVAAHKEAHPELYCSRCLWRTNGGDCPRHARPVAYSAPQKPCGCRSGCSCASGFDNGSA